MIFQSVKEWLHENYPEYCGEVTVDLDRKKVEEQMAADHPELKVQVPRFTYKRYDYGLSRLVAHKFAHDIGALEHGFHARLTNSGMSALCVVNEALRGQCEEIALAKILYGETSPVFETNCAKIQYIDSSNMAEMREFIKKPGRRAIVVETVGNGPSMPVCNFHVLLGMCWSSDVVLVLDNTLASSSSFNPFVYYRQLMSVGSDPKCKLVYVESLSKYYKANDSDDVTAGVIVAPEKFIGRCDNALKWGHYLPFPSLAKLPFDLVDAARDRMLTMIRTSSAVKMFLQAHPSVLNVVSNNYEVKSAPVIFFEIKNTEDLLARLERGLGSIKGSFGHPETTYLPFGAFMDDMPDGLVRLAIGYNESPDQIIDKLKVVLESK